MTTWNLDKICTCGKSEQPCKRHVYEPGWFKFIWNSKSHYCSPSIFNNSYFESLCGQTVSSGLLIVSDEEKCIKCERLKSRHNET